MTCCNAYSIHINHELMLKRVPNSAVKTITMTLGSTFVFLSILLLFCVKLSSVNANSYREFLRMGQSVKISDTVVSYGGNYELGFFTRNRENSTKYYVGIWFKKVPKDKIIWVANRDYAFQTSSTLLTIHPDGNIVIIDGQMTYLVTNVSNNSYSTYATVLDSGNLVLLNTSNKAVLWQSFNHPTDTLLPGMNIGHNIDTRYTLSLRSWTSAEDPAPGPYTLQYDAGLAILTINKGSNVLWVDGNSNLSIQGVLNRVDLQLKRDYDTFSIGSNSRLVLEVSGDLKYQGWSEESKRWLSLQSSKCGTNNSCGIFSICNPQDHVPCHCLNGFEPFDADSWRKGNRSAGCVRINELSCSSKNSIDGFERLLSSVELPPYEVNLQFDALSQCNNTCYTNCSCVAYAYDFNGNCMLWNDQVQTLKNISTDIQDGNNNKPIFYFRLAGSDLHPTSKLKEPTLPLCYLSFSFLYHLKEYRTRKHKISSRN